MSTITAAAERRINIVQGERLVTDDPAVLLTTLLGSCVAACLHDRVAGIGGINHFLLPGHGCDETGSLRHGVHAMELLVNDLLHQGAKRNRIEAKLFGGARMLRGLTDVGAANAAFAEGFLAREGIRHAGGSLRGEQGRRVQFFPTTGRARQAFMESASDAVFERERYVAHRPADYGTVELF